MMRITTIALMLGLCLFGGCFPRSGVSHNSGSSAKYEQGERDEEIIINPQDLAEIGVVNPAILDVETSTGAKIKASGVGLTIRSISTTNKSETSKTEVDFFEPKNRTLIILSALCVIAGIVVAIWLKQVVMGLALGVAGGCLFGFLYYPWLGIVAVAFAAIFAGYYVYLERNRTKSNGRDEVYKIVTQAIEDMGEEARPVKDKIKAAAGPMADEIKSVISGLKKAK